MYIQKFSILYRTQNLLQSNNFSQLTYSQEKTPLFKPPTGRGSHLVRTVSIGQSSTLVHSSDRQRCGWKMVNVDSTKQKCYRKLYIYYSIYNICYIYDQIDGLYSQTHIYKRQKDARVLFKNDRDEEGFNRNDFHCTL